MPKSIDDQYSELDDEIGNRMSEIMRVERSRYYPKSLKGTLTRSDIIAMRRTRNFILKAFNVLNAGPAEPGNA